MALTKSSKGHHGYVGIGGLLAVMYICVDNPLAASSFFGEIGRASFFYQSALVGAIAGSLVLAGRGVLSTRAPKGRFAFGVFFAILGVLGGYGASLLSLPGPAFVMCGAVFGAGCSAAMIRWGCLYAALSEKDSVGFMSLAGIGGAALKLAALALSTTFAEGSLVVMVVSLLASARLPRANPPIGMRPVAEGDDLLDRTRAIVVQNWKMIAGLLLCIFISAATWSALLGGLGISNDPGSESAWGNALGLLVAPVALYAIARMAPWGTFRVLYQAAPLLCVSGMLLIWFFGESGGIASRLVFSIPLGVALAAMSILFWVRLALSRDELPSSFVFGLALAGYAAFFLLVFEIWPVVGDQGMNLIDLCLMVLFLAAVGVETIVRQQKPVPAPPSVSGVDMGRLMGERCLEVAEAFQLSKREREILELLVQGRSAPSIAEELFVSVNTIKTHVKRIYGKLGVHSKEELLDVVHGSC